MTRSSGLSAAGVGSMATLLLWTSRLPLGVPGEWTWGRLEYSPAGLLGGGLMVVSAAAAYLLLAACGERRIAVASGLGAAAWLAALTAGGFLWLTSVQSAAMEGVGLGKVPYVLYYRRTEGYYWQARREITSVREFLRGYETLLAQRDYLHLGTHPPGLTLLHRGLISLCERYDGLTTLGAAMTPETVGRALDLIQISERASGREFTRVDRAALWWGGVLTQLAAVLTVVPLYGWLRLTCSRAAAWRAACLWPLVPSVGVFLPKSDLLYPVVAMTAAVLWRRGWRSGRWRPCAAAGVCLFAGMSLSLAFLPVAALIGVQTVCDGWPGGGENSAPNRREQVRSALANLAAGGGGFAVGLLAAAACGLNLLSVWSWNLSNHALFYEHNVRTWWKWLLVNPLELTLAAGAPLIVAVIGGVWKSVRGGDGASLRRSGMLAFLTVWGLLWLSGKNMGEAARLWILLIPWLTAGAAAVLEAEGMPPAGNAQAPQVSVPETTMTGVGWLALLVLQGLTSAATILRVDGFHFTELAGG